MQSFKCSLKYETHVESTIQLVCYRWKSINRVFYELGCLARTLTYYKQKVAVYMANYILVLLFYVAVSSKKLSVKITSIDVVTRCRHSQRAYGKSIFMIMFTKFFSAHNMLFYFNQIYQIGLKIPFIYFYLFISTTTNQFTIYSQYDTNSLNYIIVNWTAGLFFYIIQKCPNIIVPAYPTRELILHVKVYYFE